MCFSTYDSWLTTPPEPLRRNYSGTCQQCQTEHFNGPGNSFDTSKCATEICQNLVCESCEICVGCGGGICHWCQRSDQSLTYCKDCFREYCDSIADGVYKAGPNFARTEDERRICEVVGVLRELAPEEVL